MATESLEHESMLSDPRYGAERHSLTHNPSSREWIPIWLRTTRLFPLATYCLAIVACLEILDVIIRRNHGLPADSEHRGAVNAVKYMPTVGIIIFGFFWKATTSDAKRITPWSSMSDKWSKGSDSVGMDYLTAIEVFTVIAAARRRSWAVLTAILVGFILGALVAVANSLLYVDLFASSAFPATYEKTTHFNFSRTLEIPGNESLTIPYTALGQKPYAAVAAERLPNGRSAPWTKDGYVFESFRNTSKLPINATIEATVGAFYLGFNCYQVELQLRNDTDETTIALEADMATWPDLNCSSKVSRWYETRQTSDKEFFGSLDIVACDQESIDLRLLSNFAMRERDNSSIGLSTKVASLMCSPSFTVQEARVRANQTTGEILNYAMASTPRPANTNLSTAAIYIYLNDPLDSRSQEGFSKQPFPPYMSDDRLPSTNMTSIDTAVWWLVRQWQMDPFTSSLTNNNATAKSYLEDTSSFQRDVENLSRQTIAQVVNFLARQEFSDTVQGNLWIAGPKAFLRQVPLRVTQALLVLISIACILQATKFRPKTLLSQDPSSIASSAITLAASAKLIENNFQNRVFSSEEQLHRDMKSQLWRLYPNANGVVMFKSRLNYHKTLDPNVTLTKPLDSSGHQGFRPIPLHWWAKLTIITSVLTAMIIMAALLVQSISSNGLCRNTSSASNAAALLPSLILVLLGYACSGIDSAVRTMAPYNTLWKGSCKRHALLFNLFDPPSICAPFSAIKNGLGFTVAASSFAILLIPGVKIITAGLYNVQLVQMSRPIYPLVDTSIADNLQETFGLPLYTQAITERVSQSTEWTMNSDFNIPVSSGILENLVFSNLASIGNFSEVGPSAGEISLNIPAISVNVTCNSLSMGFNVSQSYCNGDSYFQFSSSCPNYACKHVLNLTGSFDPAGPSDLARTAIQIGGKESGACGDTSSRFIGSTLARWDSGYHLSLADFQGDQGLASTTVYTNQTDNTVLDLKKLNVTYLPTIRSAICYVNLSFVTVDTTFARKTSLIDNRTASASSWSPIRFNASSLKTQLTYHNPPYWIAPPAKYKSGTWVSQYDHASNSPGLLNSPSLWPPRGSSTSFFELLASYSQYKLGSLTAILDPDVFRAACEAICTSYATNMLTELRPFAQSSNASAAAAASPQPRPGTITFPEARIVQDLWSTIALEVLLGIMAACLICVAIRCPSGALLPKSPGSIAAMASLVAGSTLVETLRQDGVTKVGETKIWEEGKARLGWWPKASTERDRQEQSRDEAEEDEEREERDNQGTDAAEESLGSGDRLKSTEMRWGIDIGDGVIRLSWRTPPGKLEE